MPSKLASDNINELLRQLQETITRKRKVRREQANLLWFAELETKGLDAYIYPDEDDAGNHPIAGYDHSGRRVVGTAKYVDPQSEQAHCFPATGSFASSQRAVTSDNALPNDIACDASKSVRDRIEALHEWVIADNDSAACYILSELTKQQTSDEWLTSLVFAAEDVRFSGEEQQQQAAGRLRAIGLELRQRSDTKSEQAVYSAVRRFASLTPEEDADGLADFLHHRDSIDTRLIALQCVGYIFEAKPPSTAASIRILRDRLFDLASKFLDTDILVPGETSAIAEQVVAGLAATGDDRLDTCIFKVKSMGVPWFADVVYQNLKLLCNTWLSEDPNVRNHPAFQRVSNILEDWKSPCVVKANVSQ